MASNYTENYGLCQWEATDQVLRTEFNEDNAKIDTALQSQADSISSLSNQMKNKASTATVEQKVDKSALESEKAAREAADIALAQSQAKNMATLRSENCWVKLGEVVVTSEQQEINFDLSHVDITQYQMLELQILSSPTANGALGMRFNGRTDVYFSSSSDSKNFAPISPSCTWCSGWAQVRPYLTTGGVALLSYLLGNRGGAGTYCTNSDKLNYTEITSIQIVQVDISDIEVSFKGGSSFRLYGLKI